MALVLSLGEAQDFFIADERFVIEEIYDDASFLLTREQGGKSFEVTNKSVAEIMPDVLASSGGFQASGVVRIALDAPREIRILRGDLYRRHQSNEVRDHPQ